MHASLLLMLASRARAIWLLQPSLPYIVKMYNFIAFNYLLLCYCNKLRCSSVSQLHKFVLLTCDG